MPYRLPRSGSRGITFASMTETKAPGQALTQPADEETSWGHPRGLQTLFFTEMWERFSYYGMRALLVLYMTAPLENGGLGFKVVDAAKIYGTYTFSVYLSALPGGWLADRVLGQKRAVLFGGITIALGHFCLAMNSLPAFYLGLSLIVIGTGLLKPNISTMVGGLYGEKDPRRDAGFSIFYMGINLGGFIAPLVCGYLAQAPSFLGYLDRHGINPHLGWHFAFGAAGIGMCLGLIQYLAGRRHLLHVGHGSRSKPDAAADHLPQSPLTSRDFTRLAAIAILFCFSSLFWSAFEQAGSSLNLFADQLTENRILGFRFPSSWLQSVNSLFIIALAPVFAWLWIRLGKREPSSPSKFAWGLLFVGLSFVLVGFGAMVALHTGSKVSPWWLIGVYLLDTVAELSLSPVGLSTVTKLAPARFASLMMGVWFTSLAVGNYVGGWIAGHFDPGASLSRLFFTVAAVEIGAAVVLWLLVRPIKKLMAGVQ